MIRFLLCITVLLFPMSASAGDYTGQLGGSVVVYKNGQPMHVNKTDAGYMLLRMIKLFNSSTISTAHSRMLVQSLTRDGSTLEDKWNDIKTENYYSARLNPPKAKFVDSVILDEIIVSIAASDRKNPLGLVMAKLKNGEIRAYEVDNQKLINLYCLDRGLKYLPGHYTTFAQKYSAPEYKNSDIQCSTQTTKK